MNKEPIGSSGGIFLEFNQQESRTAQYLFYCIALYGWALQYPFYCTAQYCMRSCESVSQARVIQPQSLHSGRLLGVTAVIQEHRERPHGIHGGCLGEPCAAAEHKFVAAREEEPLRNDVAARRGLRQGMELRLPLCLGLHLLLWL